MSNVDAWVEVEMVKGPMVSVYRGRLDKDVFERWQRGEITQGTLELQDAYWSYDDGEGNEGWVVVGGTAGPYSNARGSAHLRADLIMVMLPLRDGSERQAHLLRPSGSASRGDD